MFIRTRFKHQQSNQPVIVVWCQLSLMTWRVTSLKELQVIVGHMLIRWTHSSKLFFHHRGYANACGTGWTLHSDIVMPYIVEYGTKEQIEKFIPAMAAGKNIGAIAMTEPGAGRCIYLKNSFLVFWQHQLLFISSMLTTSAFVRTTLFR